MSKRKNKVAKTQPGSSDVHVPVPMGEEKLRKAAKAHSARLMTELRGTLGRMTQLLDEFFEEEEQEKVGKLDAGRRIAKIAVIHDGKLLMGKRRDNGKWTIPGGHVEPQETMREGAIRELWEETGIEIVPTQLMPLTDLVDLTDRAGKPLCVQAYIVRLDDRPSTSMLQDPDGEVHRWKWTDISEGLDEDIADNLHVPGERCTVMQALNLVTVAKAVDADADPDMLPGIDNLEAGMLKSALGKEWEDGDDTAADENWHPNDSNQDSMWDMQGLVEGTDWELAHSTQDPEVAHEVAMSNLEGDKDYYRKLNYNADRTDDVLEKDTRETEQEPWANEGLKIDVGSGNAREAGHIGLDTYPYDHGTLVHDVNMGLPFEDGSVSQVRLVNALHDMDGLKQDPTPLLSEIHRVMMPGGKFKYEGPDEIYDPERWAQNYPGFVLTNHEDRDKVGKDDEDAGKLTRHVFTRIASPDPATANDAEPRFGVGQAEGIPGDQLLAADALGYYWSDATSSGRGNRLHGYPSQGALVDGGAKYQRLSKDQMAEGEDDGNANSTPQTLEQRQVADALKRKVVNPPAPGRPTVTKVAKMLAHGKVVPILKAVAHKQIVYGVILEPNEIDAQDDFMDPEEIEKAAHRYLSKSRVIGSSHEKPIDAEPVESFIAPQDLELDGQYGPQKVKKGSWILGVKVHDPKEWQKILDGDYTGFSVGGLGERETT